MPESYTQLVPFKYGHAKQILVLKNDPHVSESIRLTGEFSPAEVRVFEKFIRPGDTVIDAGALYGEHTLPMAELVGPTGWVYAFEPQRIPFQILCGNCQLNSMRNVRAIQCALGLPGAVCMEVYDPFVSVGWGLNRTQALTDRGQLGPTCGFVESWHLDHSQYERLSFIKLDVEGDEVKVIEGAWRTLHAHQPVLYIEYQSNREQLSGYLRTMGYSLYLHKAPADPRDTGVPMLLALPPGKEVESEWLKELGFERI